MGHFGLLELPRAFWRSLDLSGLPGLRGAAWGSPGLSLGFSWGSLGSRCGSLGLWGQIWIAGHFGFGCLTYLLLVACCLSFGWRFDNGFLAFGRWQVGPLVVGRVGGWVRWLLVGLGVGSLD